MTRVPRSETGQWPWRYRCPEGHASVYLSAHSYRCRTCTETYDKDELQDLAEPDQHV